jgi:hypothetical protein
VIRQRLVYHAGMTACRAELIAAALCVMLGVLAAAYALFRPTITVAIERATADERFTGIDAIPPDTVIITNTRRSMFEGGVEPSAAVYLALMTALPAGIAALAFAHGRWPATRSAAPLWGAAVALTLLSLIAGFSIGPFFLPAALAAVVSAAAASRYAAQLRR